MTIKRYLFTFILGLHIFANSLSAQTNLGERLIFPFLTLESQSNIIVTANWDHPQPCPAEYTNLLSNTNLFALAEQRMLQAVTEKYKNVKDTSGPAGSMFKGWALRRMKYVELTGVTDTFQVARFAYTNSSAQEEIMSDKNSIIAKYWTPPGDGYVVEFVDNSLITYQEYKNAVLDGLFVSIHDPNHPDADDHCDMWARFAKGKVVGKFIAWGGSKDKEGHLESKIIIEAEFTKPFDFIKNQSIPIELAWEEVPTNTIKITPKSP